MVAILAFAGSFFLPMDPLLQNVLQGCALFLIGLILLPALAYLIDNEDFDKRTYRTFCLLPAALITFFGAHLEWLLFGQSFWAPSFVLGWLCSGTLLYLAHISSLSLTSRK